MSPTPPPPLLFEIQVTNVFYLHRASLLLGACYSVHFFTFIVHVPQSDAVYACWFTSVINQLLYQPILNNSPINYFRCSALIQNRIYFFLVNIHHLTICTLHCSFFFSFRRHSSSRVDIQIRSGDTNEWAAKASAKTRSPQTPVLHPAPSLPPIAICRTLGTRTFLLAVPPPL